MLGDIAAWGSGGTPSRAVREYFGPGLPWLSIADLDDGPVGSAKESLTPLGLQNSSAKPVPAGALLIAMYGSIGKLGIATRELCTSQAIAFAIPDTSRIDTRYLFHYLLAQRPLLQARGRGGTQSNIGQSDLKSWRIPLPSLPEQRRRAAILDKADALLAKRRVAMVQLDTLVQSIFMDMFGDPVTNPRGWPIKRVQEISECLDRLRRPVTESDRKHGVVPYYGANGQQGWIDRALFSESLVLVAEDGGHFDSPHRGVAYRIDGPAWVNNHAHILRALPEHLETEFLHRVLRHFDFSPYISGTTRAKLTQGQLNAVKLIVPPLKLQRVFAVRVAAVLHSHGKMMDATKQLEELNAVLRYRAFEGELATRPSEMAQVTC